MSTLNLDTFNEMKELMEDTLDELLDTYLENTPELIANLKLHLEQGNAEECFKCAHQIKGSSSSLGVDEVALIAKTIEEIGRAGSLDGISEKITELESKYTLALVEIEKNR